MGDARAPFRRAPSGATVLPVAWAVLTIGILLFVRPFGRRCSCLRARGGDAHGLVEHDPAEQRPSLATRRRAAALHAAPRRRAHDPQRPELRLSLETDFSERWETRSYDLAKLDRLDFFMSYWGSPSIAHTIMSWAFTDGQHLAISIETRKEVGETYSAVAGFFRQYELYYVAADERDVIRVRTNYRGEDVYLYPLRTPRDRMRRALLEYAEAMNRLAVVPEFYNAGTGNCTTTIRTNIEHMGLSMPFDWRFLVNGYLNELLYEKNVTDTSRPLEVVKASSLIDARAKAADQDIAFSSRIREGIVVPLRFDEPGGPPLPR
jgi:hypothetical protein